MALNQELRSPGDELVAQLAQCCPRLRALALPDTALQGGGLRRPRWAPPGGGAWLGALRRLEIAGTVLLRSSVRMALCACC